jgi:hypothetical protein
MYDKLRCSRTMSVLHTHKANTMLSVRLPEDLEKQLTTYCIKQKLQKSKVVQAAIRKHLQSAGSDPFLSLVGSGNGKYTTEQIMKMSRGDDWNAK